MDLRLRLQFIQLLIAPRSKLAVSRADRERILGRRSPGALGALGEVPVLALALVAEDAFREAGVVGVGGGGTVSGADMAVESGEDGHAGDDDADELLAEFEDGDGGDGDGLVLALAGDDFVAEAHDAGYDGHAADEEDGGDLPFLVRRHVQPPDGDDGDDEDHDVAGDVDGAGADQERVFVDALFAARDGFLFTGAFGCFGEDQGDGV